MVEWRGKPVYIVRRTSESLDAINAIDTSILRDADSEAAAQPSYVSGSARTMAGKEDYISELPHLHQLIDVSVAIS